MKKSITKINPKVMKKKKDNTKLFIAIILFNAIYNIILSIIKKREFIFYYNFIYIILFIILLFA